MKKKVAVLTWHYYKNFGSALQAYALQEVLTGLGYYVKIIDYRNPKYGKISKPKDLLKVVLVKVFRINNFINKKIDASYSSYYIKHLKLTKLVQNVDILPSFKKKFDIFVCGSDQIWAPNVFNPTYFLDFIDNDTKKISYAASIGLNNIDNNLVPEYKRLLSRFYAISVRESTGAELLRNECNISADVVIDPTLLLDSNEWIKLENKPFLHIVDKYIFCYFLNDMHNYGESVRKFASENGYEVIGVSKNTSDKNWMEIIPEDVGPQEFIWLIHNADVIFTDSYHGTIFSLLFHKKFLTFERFASDDKICQNSRIYQLIDYFDIKDNVISLTEAKELKPTSVDYNKFDKKLYELRNYSLNFLKKSLEE